MPFLVISRFAEFGIFRFWPKTMDYNSLWFDEISFRAHNSSLEGAMVLNVVKHYYGKAYIVLQLDLLEVHGTYAI